MNTSSINGILLMFWICLHMVVSNIAGSPLFFSSPFGTTKAPELELESISVYTTSSPDASRKSLDEKPSIYQQLARNALERIVSPVVSHFILVTATQSSKLVSTPLLTSKLRKSSNKHNQNIETLDEEVIEDEEMANSTVKNASDPDFYHKEPIDRSESKNPEIVNDTHSDKPERLVINLNSKIENDAKVATEVDDLNKPVDDESVSSDTNDMGNEIETVDIGEESDESDVSINFPEDGDSETPPEMTTPKQRGSNRNFSESGLIFVLEILGTIYTLGMGLVSSLFPNPMAAKIN